jgi:hypothetical protein
MPPESLTPSPDSERERAAFEAWAKKNGYELDIDSDSYGWGYMFESTGDAWEGWCGRASLSEYAQTKPIPQELAQVVTDALECGALWTEGSEAHPRMKLALRAFKVWVGGDSSQHSGDGGHSARASGSAGLAQRRTAALAAAVSQSKQATPPEAGETK